MLETPAQYNEWLDTQRYPLDQLGRYSYHTGASLRPLGAEEPCPILFRDIGSVAMEQFLRGRLQRLCGPYSPIIYMRTEAYQEPYIDYEKIGRLVFLRPLELHPWHSGVDHIYIAHASRQAHAETLGYVPGEFTLAQARALASEAPSTSELREIFGGVHYDQSLQESLFRLEQLNIELAQTEQLAMPLRRLLQSSQTAQKARARELMHKFQIQETDLCCAWHHLPLENRNALKDALQRLPPLTPSTREKHP